MEQELDKQRGVTFEVDPIGFETKINHAGLYHLSYSAMNDLHKEGRMRDAIEYFNAHVLPAFQCVFDKVFFENCIEITENVKDYKQRYMLIKGEFSRLMTRCGIAPKPDIRIRYDALWEVPKDISELSFDGKEKREVEEEEDDGNVEE